MTKAFLQSALVKGVGLSVLALSLSGCLDKITGKEEAKQETLEPVTVGVVMARNDDNSPYLQAYYKAFQSNAAQNPNVNLLLDDAKDDQDTQFKLLDEMVAKGAKGLAINLVDRKRGGEAVARYCGKVHLMFISNPGDRELASCPDTYRILPDSFSAGAVQGNEIIKQWGQNPDWDKNGDRSIQFAIMASRRDSVRGLGENVEWAMETINRDPKSNLSADIVLEGEAMYQTNLAKEVAEKWLADERFAEVELVLAASDSMAMGIIETFKAHDIKLPIFSYDALPYGKKAVEAGNLRYTVEYNVEEESKVAIQVLENLIRGNRADLNLRHPIKDREIKVPVKGMHYEQ